MEKQQNHSQNKKRAKKEHREGGVGGEGKTEKWAKKVGGRKKRADA